MAFVDLIESQQQNEMIKQIADNETEWHLNLTHTLSECSAQSSPLDAGTTIHRDSRSKNPPSL